MLTITTEYEINQYNSLEVAIALDGRTYVKVKDLTIPDRANPLRFLACFSGA